MKTHDTGCNQGRTGPTAEGCRAMTEAICRSLLRDCWPLFVLAALMLACGWWFR